MAVEGSNWPEFGFACNGGGGCVLVERIAGVVVIRDSKNPTQPGLVFSMREYNAFRRRVLASSWPSRMLQYAASVLRSITVILRVIR